MSASKPFNPTSSRVGTSGNSGERFRVCLLKSGTEGKGRWTDERVNLLDDYRKYFDVSDTPKPAGIAVLTDADDTKTAAAGDYADFRACRK